MKPETRRPEPLTILKAAVVYFVLVFGTGFVLGPIRILLLVPRFGVRLAELMDLGLLMAGLMGSMLIIFRDTSIRRRARTFRP